MQTAGISPHCLPSHTSTSSKSRVRNRSLETQSQPFPACFSHLFLTACSCHLDLSGLDLVISDVVWHFQFIRNAFVYLLGEFFFFISFFHFFFFPRLCGGFLPQLPMQTSPPVPGGATHTRALWNQDSYQFQVLWVVWGLLLNKKGRLIMFLYFSVLFYHFIIKSQVLEHRSKWGFKIQTLFLNLLKTSKKSLRAGVCWWHFQFTQPVFAFLSRLSLLPVACKCEFASKLKMAQPDFMLLHLPILPKIHHTSLQCWTDSINRWVSVPGQYWDCGPALPIACCSP